MNNTKISKSEERHRLHLARFEAKIEIHDCQAFCADLLYCSPYSNTKEEITKILLEISSLASKLEGRYFNQLFLNGGSKKIFIQFENSIKSVLQNLNSPSVILSDDECTSIRDIGTTLNKWDWSEGRELYYNNLE